MNRMMSFVRNQHVSPGMHLLSSTGYTMGSRYRCYTHISSKRYHASRSKAWHRRSDAFSSIGSLVGIAGAIMGLPIMDAIASVVICIFILKAAIDIFRDTVGKMTDRACSDDMVRQMQDTILRQEDVMGIALLQTRLFGYKIYVDVEIGVDGNATLVQGRDIADTVHDTIEEVFPDVKHCMVHINPHEKQMDKGVSYSV